ncbi:MAG: hypothetical protein M3282_07445 [Gemmatimonadota bacterium]|nr:hypothetical protein [Gemmatimonadota bacterium]
MLIVRKILVVSAAALAALAAPGVARAQAAPIDLQVDVQPTASFLAGNVTRVSYVVANTARSTERLFEFAVRSPVPVWRLEVPTPRTQYLGTTREGGEDVASWGWLDEMPRPGESSPVLAYEAIGLPGIVAYRALRYFGVRSARRGHLDEPEELRFDRAGAEYTVGKTVGVVSLPIDLRPSALASRLRRLVGQACELGWVDGPAVCRSLHANARPSVRAVRAFHRELVAQRGKAVGEAAFALLAPNAEFLLGKL